MPPKLVVDPTDYKSLKSLLALEVSSGDHLGVFTSHSKGSISAVLEVDSEVRLFSENAICSYFLEEVKKERSLSVLTWLEWESNLLQPYLCPVVSQAWGGSKVSEHVMQTSKELLSHLDKNLKGKKHLVGDVLSAADVSIWVTVYPLASNDRLAGSYLNEFPSVCAWHDRLAKLDPFSKVTTIATNGSGSSFFKASFLRESSFKLPPGSKVDGSKNLDRSISESTATTEHVDELTPEEVAESFESWLNGRKSVPMRKKLQHPILPIDGERNILITSSLPYVNNVPHLGNIIGCVLSADVFARYCRLKNYNILYICGTDEYGTATETKAIEEGVSPQEICDKYFKLHSKVYEWFQISFDHFGRTTTPQQTEIAQDLFWRLYRNGFTFEDSLEQLLCPKCNRFLADRFVEGTCPLCGYDDARGDQCDKCGKLLNAIELKSPRCKLCKTEPVKKVSKHLFLDLPKLSKKVIPWFDKVQETGIWSQSAKVITKAWLRDGLKPRCITRDLEWGVKVPLEGFTNKVFYVWYDAPIGYPSITACYTDEWKQWWKNPNQVKLYQFMAKDNVPFHAVIFPACLLGVDDGYTIVGNMSATEYLNYEDGKFSKSRGVGVFGTDAIETGIPADIWRFYLLYVRPETQDSAFSWSDLMTKNNSELLNNLGNFINRSLMFLSNFFDGKVPVMNLLDDDQTFIALINRELQTYGNLLESLRLRDAIRHILNVSRLGNQHIQNHKPWVLVKGSKEEKERAGTVIGLGANIACLLSIMLDPYMPTTAKTIQSQLNANLDSIGVLPDKLVCFLEPDHQIGKPSPLFRKIESEEMDRFRKRFAGTQSSREGSPQAAPQQTANASESATVINGIVDVEELKIAITNQGEVVRALKTKGAIKADIDVEVAKLLELKKRLSLSTGQTSVPSKEKKKKSKKSGTS